MSDNTLSYSTGPYLPPPQYYQTPNVVNQIPQLPTVPRPDLAQRKRPKYTRSKTGCMTCRVKKIKCDESKPVCMRCTHGSRECSWPEGVPTRKKSNAKKDSIDDRPSTAGSSGMSESPTPPNREESPPRRNTLDLSLLPLPTTRTSDAFAGLHSLGTEHDATRRPLERASSYPQPSSHMLSLMPEPQFTSRYDHTYLNGQTARGMPAAVTAAPYRPTLSHQPASHWGHTESLDTYYHGHHAALQERPLVGHTSSMDHSHNRYQ